MSDVTAGELRHKRQLGMLPHQTGDGSKAEKEFGICYGWTTTVRLRQGRISGRAVRRSENFRRGIMRCFVLIDSAGCMHRLTYITVAVYHITNVMYEINSKAVILKIALICIKMHFFFPDKVN